MPCVKSGNDVTLRIQPDSPRAEAELVNVEVLDSGPLFTRVLLRKQLLKSTVEQTLTLWNRQPRLDLETCIYWHGEHHQQIRLNLPSAEAGRIVHGSPFYGVGWDETVEGTSPYNPDEVTPPDQAAYREVHDWIHLWGETGGLSIITNHPGFHLQDDAVAAVLIRTSPSCGDGRLFFENAGKQVFSFHLIPGETDWRAAHTPVIAQAMHRLPVAKRYVSSSATADNNLPNTYSLLSMTKESGGALQDLALSSLYPAHNSSDVLLRVWDTTGRGEDITLSGPLAQAGAALADLMDNAADPLSGQPGRWRLDVPPYGIRSVRLSRKG